MKRLFLDTNFIIDYLLRDEFKQDCINLLAKGKRDGYSFHISFLSIANFAYIARKAPKEDLYGYIARLSKLFSVVPNNARQLERAMALDARDFEDALQYQSAIDAKCDFIITRNQKDFPFSTIPVMSASDYVDTYF